MISPANWLPDQYPLARTMVVSKAPVYPICAAGRPLMNRCSSCVP